MTTIYINWCRDCPFADERHMCCSITRIEYNQQEHEPCAAAMVGCPLKKGSVTVEMKGENDHEQLYHGR